MASTRSYRQDLTENKGLAIIKENKGNQFALEVVKAFMKGKQEED